MSQVSYTEPTRDDARTADLVEWHDSVVAAHDDDFETAKELVTRLGARLTQ